MKRVDIKTGFVCNNNCLFCAQAHNKEKGNKSEKEIRNDLLEARKNNCEGVVFTGGEITIRKDFPDLIAYAKRLGFKVIQLQTNARILSYKPYCRRLVELGANEFSPALHGHNPEIHDYLTRSSGSFAQTVQAIKNIRELDQCIITNSVVNKINLPYLTELAELLVELKVNQFQMAFVHPVGNAMKYYDDIVPNITEASEKIKKALDIGINAGISVMAEAMPYCLMQGYEKYISENYIPETEIRAYGYIDLDYTNTRLTSSKIKFEKCKICSKFKICEGPWKEYPERFGEDEFRPI
jgi:MoaA/NifB/PqqE/SkfB family radical SAM enzyme